MKVVVSAVSAEPELLKAEAVMPRAKSRLTTGGMYAFPAASAPQAMVGKRSSGFATEMPRAAANWYSSTPRARKSRLTGMKAAP